MKYKIIFKNNKIRTKKLAFSWIKFRKLKANNTNQKNLIIIIINKTLIIRMKNKSNNK